MVKGMEGIDRALIQRTIHIFAWRGSGKLRRILLRTAGFEAEI